MEANAVFDSYFWDDIYFYIVPRSFHQEIINLSYFDADDVRFYPDEVLLC
jgi:hypothetical protein